MGASLGSHASGWPGQLDRRHFLDSARVSLGGIALASLLGDGSRAAASPAGISVRKFPQQQPRAKRVIYLFQSGGTSQFESFDYKPKLRDLRGEELPDSIRQGQRLTGMTANQKHFPIAPSIFDFQQHGESGAWVSELLPYTAAVSDECCFIKSMDTEAINHDPAITFVQTGSQLAGRPSMGALGFVRTGGSEPGPAGLHGAGLAGDRPGRRTTAVRPPVGKRLSPLPLPGREAAEWE